MGRCQSTPGLVESRGRVPLEEMWVPSMDAKSAHGYPASHSLFSPSPSPVTSRGLVGAGNNVNVSNVTRGVDSPMSATSSGHSSEDRSDRQSTTVRCHTAFHWQAIHTLRWVPCFRGLRNTANFRDVFLLRFFFCSWEAEPLCLWFFLECASRN